MNYEIRDTATPALAGARLSALAYPERGHSCPLPAAVAPKRTGMSALPRPNLRGGQECPRSGNAKGGQP